MNAIFGALELVPLQCTDGLEIYFYWNKLINFLIGYKYLTLPSDDQLVDVVQSSAKHEETYQLTGVCLQPHCTGNN